MKRLMSMKLKVKRNTNMIVTKSGLVHSEMNKTHSISTTLALAVDPQKTGPTSSELNIISKYTKKGESECLKLKNLIFEYLTLSEDKHKLIEILKIFIVLDFILITGSPEFYYIFVNGNQMGSHGECVWKLKVLLETITGREEVVERIRKKLSELLWMCQDYQHWEDRRAEYNAIRQEIHMPSSRRSFDISGNRDSHLSQLPSPVHPSNFPPKLSLSQHRRHGLSQINESDEITSASPLSQR